MFSLVLSAAVQGIEAYLVKVESHLESGLLAFTTVGLPEGAVRESKERVTAAIKNSGYPFPQKRITINLAPADVRNEGSAFDLPIAIGILASTGLIRTSGIKKFIILGELALDGKLRPVKGALPISTIGTIARAERNYSPQRECPGGFNGTMPSRLSDGQSQGNGRIF